MFHDRWIAGCLFVGGSSQPAGGRKAASTNLSETPGMLHACKGVRSAKVVMNLRHGSR
jgi:hypothetical protein